MTSRKKENMKPIIKWAGGKGYLLETVKAMQPAEYNRYIEPFGGGAAIMFGMHPSTSLLNDINSELMNVYQQVKCVPAAVIAALNAIDGLHESAPVAKDFYYETRSVFNANQGSGTPEQAARFIYLNKHCFNGLYRVNSEGDFNVSFNGRLSGNSCEPTLIMETSLFLRTATITNEDFEPVLSRAQKGDFVFIDPPNIPIKAGSFTEYTPTGFSMSDHIRLAECCKELTNKGVFFLMTNSDTPMVKSLYATYNTKTVDIACRMNCNGSNRKSKGIIITNY